MIWASIGVFSEKNGDETVADSTKSLVKAILGVARWVFTFTTLITLQVLVISLMIFPQHPTRHQDRHSGGETVEMALGAKRTRPRQVLHPNAKESFPNGFNEVSI